MTEPKKRPVVDEQTLGRLDAAMGELMRDGHVSSARCDICGSLIEIKALGDSAQSMNCACGKFKGSLRGL